jgi:ubiquinone/menaquinone biosynthesis C-methylase UbiE
MGVYEAGGHWYDALHFGLTFGREERLKDAAIDKLGITPGDRVLDWGCGTGLSLRLIRDRLGESGTIYAVDASAAMLKRAVARARPTDDLVYHFIVRRGVRQNLPEPVDHVVASYSLGVLPPELQRPALEEIRNALRPGGRLLIISMYRPQPRNAWQRIFHALKGGSASRYYGQNLSELLREEAQSLFRTVELEYIPGHMTYMLLGEKDTEG